MTPQRISGQELAYKNALLIHSAKYLAAMLQNPGFKPIESKPVDLRYLVDAAVTMAERQLNNIAVAKAPDFVPELNFSHDHDTNH